MNKVIKYKLNYLISNRLIITSVIILVLILNFEAIINSGILFSGGENFNISIKYELLLNNYIIVASFYGLLLAVYLGASIVGPDIQTGNLYILLSSYPFRKSYFLGTYLAVFLFSSILQILLLANILILFVIYQVPFVWSDVLICFVQIFLNVLVVLTVTGFASIFMKGHSASIVGLLGYSFFNVYTYNELPFVKASFIFDITRHKDILCNLFPISAIFAPSYSSVDVIRYYCIQPIIPNVYCYQIFYILLIVFLGCVCFKHKEL